MKISESDVLNASILLVDDQESNIDMLRQLLGGAGYTRVTWTMKPQEVCALHSKNRYDLIVLDLNMPGMDGFQVLEALKTKGSDGYLPVLAVTAHPGHKLHALQCGAKDFISKPFDLVEARTRIRNMLEVRLLYRKLENYSKVLEEKVQERTAELRESENRFRCLTELAADWYWEQDEQGSFITTSGPMPEILGLQEPLSADSPGVPVAGWDEVERNTLQAAIAARQFFLDFPLSRVNANGSQQLFHVSGQPMFDRFCAVTGYRGVGVEVRNSRASALKE